MTIKLEDCLAPDTLARVSEFAADYRDAKPFRHVVIENFFAPEFCQSLVQSFPPFDDQLALNEDGIVGRKCVYEDLSKLDEPYRQLDQLISSRPLLDWVGRLLGAGGHSG
jgi:hypothetical protein